MTRKSALVPARQIESLILVIRGQRVMLDADLATLYGVATSRLNEQVKRNRKRFPPDFMFQLTRNEFDRLISQIAISKSRGGRRKLPYVFTEHGAIMAANVLNSERAVEMSLYVIRAFVKLREMLSTHRKMAGKLLELEQRVAVHDQDLHALMLAIREMMKPAVRKTKPIGFIPGKEN